MARPDPGTPREWCEECEQYVECRTPAAFELHVARHARRRTRERADA